MARILVTGAGGFIGRALCPGLAARDHLVIAGLRRPGGPGHADAGIASRILGELTPATDWSAALRDVEVVIHLAQRAHQPADTGILNAEPRTAAGLANAAARAGVRRLVYLSSIKAMGEATRPGRPFRADDPPQPGDAYGRAKLASEQALRTVAGESRLELVIIRPPLVYGPGVGANFRALIGLAGSGLPLPFATIDNRRSLIAVANLVDLLATVATHPAAAGQVLLATDGTDVSTAALIRLLAQGQGRTARLFPLPQAVFAVLRKLPGLGAPVSRLTLSLQADDRLTRNLLGWVPPVAAEAALRAAALHA